MGSGHVSSRLCLPEGHRAFPSPAASSGKGDSAGPHCGRRRHCGADPAPLACGLAGGGHRGAGAGTAQRCRDRAKARPRDRGPGAKHGDPAPLPDCGSHPSQGPGGSKGAGPCRRKLFGGGRDCAQDRTRAHRRRDGRSGLSRPPRTRASARCRCAQRDVAGRSYNARCPRARRRQARPPLADRRDGRLQPGHLRLLPGQRSAKRGEHRARPAPGDLAQGGSGLARLRHPRTALCRQRQRLRFGKHRAAAT